MFFLFSEPGMQELCGTSTGLTFEGDAGSRCWASRRVSVAPGIVGWVTKAWRSDFEAEGRSQAILNAYWPPPAVSRRLVDHAWIEVMVRVVWEVDGEEWVPGTATKWWRTHVFVKIGDRRLLPQGTWLAARDVRRRNESSSPPRQT